MGLRRLVRILLTMTSGCGNHQIAMALDNGQDRAPVDHEGSRAGDFAPFGYFWKVGNPVNGFVDPALECPGSDCAKICGNSFGLVL